MENKTKVCMFIGHRSLMHSIDEETAECIRRLIVEDGVRVYCLNWEAEHVFPVNSIEAAQDLLSCDKLTLEEKE